MSTLEHPLIDRFLDALWLEKGLADNTREAYRNDLQQFNAWLDGRGLRLEGIGRDAILDHLAWRLEQGYKARSTARFLSGLRGFYRYCLRDGLIAEDPTLQVDLPQLGKPLPKSSPKRTSRHCWRRRKSTTRWACAIAPCSKCCMPAACGSANWLA